jgi:hypothetical protein
LEGMSTHRCTTARVIDPIRGDLMAELNDWSSASTALLPFSDLQVHLE